MAVGSRSSGISHNALSDMQIIYQEGDTRRSNDYSSKSSNQPSSGYGKSHDFFDDMDSQFGFSKSGSGRFRRDEDEDDLFKGFGNTSSKLKCSKWIMGSYRHYLFYNLQGDSGLRSDWVVVDDKFKDETLITSNSSDKMKESKTENDSNR